MRFWYKKNLENYLLLPWGLGRKVIFCPSLSLSTEFFGRLKTQDLWELPGSRGRPGEAGDRNLGFDFSHPLVQPEEGAGFLRESGSSSEAANMKINLEQLI